MFNYPATPEPPAPSWWGELEETAGQGEQIVGARCNGAVSNSEGNGSAGWEHAWPRKRGGVSKRAGNAAFRKAGGGTRRPRPRTRMRGTVLMSNRQHGSRRLSHRADAIFRSRRTRSRETGPGRGGTHSSPRSADGSSAADRRGAGGAGSTLGLDPGSIAGASRRTGALGRDHGAHSQSDSETGRYRGGGNASGRLRDGDGAWFGRSGRTGTAGGD